MTEYDKLIANGHTVTQVSQLEADLLRENEQLKAEVEQLQSTLREVGTALTGVECDPGQDFTGNPYVDGVAALRAEVERLRKEAVLTSGCPVLEVENEQLRALLGTCAESIEEIRVTGLHTKTYTLFELLSRIRAALGGGQ